MKHLNQSYSFNFDLRKSEWRNNNHKNENCKWKNLQHIKLNIDFKRGHIKAIVKLIDSTENNFGKIEKKV